MANIGSTLYCRRNVSFLFNPAWMDYMEFRDAVKKPMEDRAYYGGFSE